MPEYFILCDVFHFGLNGNETQAAVFPVIRMRQIHWIDLWFPCGFNEVVLIKRLIDRIDGSSEKQLASSKMLRKRFFSIHKNHQSNWEPGHVPVICHPPTRDFSNCPPQMDSNKPSYEWINLSESKMSGSCLRQINKTDANIYLSIASVLP